MGQGIRKNQKYIVDNIDRAGNAYINLNSECSDFMLNIPLYESNLTYGLKLNILFSLMNNLDNSIFGNGYRINYYKKIYEIQTDGPKEIIRIENYDYSIDNYVEDLDYVGEENEKRYNNNETSTYIITTDINLVKTYRLYDENGNYLILDIDGSYPKAICKKEDKINSDGKTYVITINNHLLSNIESKSSGEKINFIYSNNKVSEITITRLVLNEDELIDTDVLKIEFTYTNNYLTLITYRSCNNQTKTMTCSYDYNFNTKYITIIDNVSLKKHKYRLNNQNKVFEIVRTNTINDNTYVSTSILYYTKYTVYYHYGNRYFEFFDDNKLPLYSCDTYGNGCSYTYNDDRKIILSSNINGNSRYESEGNYLENSYFIDDYNPWTQDENGTMSISNMIYSHPMSDMIGNRNLFVTCNSNKTTIYQDVIFLEKQYKNLVVNIWLREASSVSLVDGTIAGINVSMFNGTIKNEEINFLFKKQESNPIWIYKCIPVNISKVYDKVRVSLIVFGNSNTVCFDGITLLQKEYGSIYYYDNVNNKLSNKKINNQETKYLYNNDNQITKSINKDGVSSQYTYNSHLELTSELIKKDETIINDTLNTNTTKIEKKFNSKNQNTEIKLINEKKVDSTTTINYIKTNNIYQNFNYDVLKGEFLSKTIDSSNKETNYEYNKKYKLLTKITTPDDVECNYTYDDWNRVSSINRKKDTFNQETANYTYSSKDNLYKMTLPGNSEYEFYYDNNNNLVNIASRDILNIASRDIQYGGISFNTIEYTNDEKKESLGFIEKLLYSNGKCLKLYYGDGILTDLLKLQKITTLSSDDTEEDFVSFYYDSFNRLKKIIDQRDYFIPTIEYFYDLNGQVVKLSQTDNIDVMYSYDNSSNVIGKTVKNYTDYYSLITNNIYSEKRYSPESLYNQIKFIKNDLPSNYLISCFFTNEKNNALTSYYPDENNKIVNLNVTPTYGSSIVNEKDGLISFIDYTSIQGRLGYNVNVFSSEKSFQTIMFWFYAPSNGFEENKYLISIGYDASKNFIGVYINDNNGISVELKENDETSYLRALFTTNTISNSSWNFVSFSWYVRENSSDPSKNSIELKLALNEVFSKKTINLNSNVYFPSGKVNINIGSKLNGTAIVSSSSIETKISSIIMGGFLTNSSIYNYYQELKDTVFNPEYNEINKLPLISGITSYNYISLLSTPTLDIIPLNRILDSIKGVKPKFLFEKEGDYYINNKMFIYSRVLNRYVYNAYKGDLSYDYSLGIEGTICLKFYKMSSSNDQYLFENVDENNKLGLFVNNANRIVIENNTYRIVTSLVVTNNTWNFASLTWKKENNVYKVRARLNLLETDEININVTNDYLGMVTYIGRKKIRTGTPLDITTCDSLNGQIELVLVSQTYSLSSTLQNYQENLYSTSKICEYDDFNNPKNYRINKNGVDVYSKTYTYKSIDSQRKTALISSETVNDVTTSYTYDDMGNVLTIKVGNDLKRTYQYNYLNFLTKEIIHQDNIYYLYSYNKNGNINAKKKYNLTTDVLIEEELFSYSRAYYENYSPDVLVKYKPADQTSYRDITYINGYQPSSYWYSDSYTFEASNMVNITTHGKYIEYIYDYNNNLVRKVIPRTGTGVTLSYEENRLIYEIRNGNKSYFLYDENDILYGIIYNNITYFYTRDILGTITGLVNEQGVQVVNYEYDAWGRILSTTGSLQDTLGYDNPFRYKSMFGNDYYYDVDSELYYCGTRWYNPLWCRFISGDDIRYFDSENIGCVNMFAYCNNNPVMMIDSYGNTPRWISMLGGMIEHSASTIARLLKLSLKAMPELSKQVAIKIARKGGWQQTAREIIRSRSNNIAETNKMISQAESVAKWTGRALLVIDIVSTTISNYKSGSKSWVTDSIIDGLIDGGIYALNAIPYVGWALSLIATVGVNHLEENTTVIQDIKNWAASVGDDISDGWNVFWSFNWI